jgi:hypothetical protein
MSQGMLSSVCHSLNVTWEETYNTPIWAYFIWKVAWFDSTNPLLSIICGPSLHLPETFTQLIDHDFPETLER